MRAEKRGLSRYVPLFVRATRLTMSMSLPSGRSGAESVSRKAIVWVVSVHPSLRSGHPINRVLRITVVIPAAADRRSTMSLPSGRSGAESVSREAIVRVVSVHPFLRSGHSRLRRTRDQPRSSNYGCHSRHG